MRVQSALLIALAASLLCTAGFGTVAAVDAPGETGPQDVRIELTADGDATWSIDHHYVLEDEDEIERFEAFVESVQTGQREIADYRGTFEDARVHAEAGTDREMPIEDGSWEDPRVRPIEAVDAIDAESAGYPENATVGTLTYSFTWRNFAETDDGYLNLQGAFLDADGEPWYATVAENQRLLIRAPPDHDFVTAPQGIENDTLTWNGYQELDAESFDISLIERPAGLSLPWLTLLGGIILLAAVAAGLWYWLSREDRSNPLESVFDDGAIAESNGGESTGTNPSSEPVGREPESSEPAAAATDVDPELLSDEERVTHMLEQNGGRMKQAAIVKETGWSNAKVSQLLSQMDEDGEIEKLRIGRENLITLPEVDPTQVE
ncbi:helix-turn-helix transcriptional regulator [Halovivax limisalsi]|uniref:helix-turn-helix transcriptional regulator n=1 Tax=Halovivax limisalsi TaxID=1453760 RepID=UPI001FFC44B3|nr:hypothetical protein [Halovivax limisalsi]